LINKIKTISGRRWKPKGKYWEVPYSENLMSNLQVLFGENLIIDPDIKYKCFEVLLWRDFK
jgi:hypothetical protein